MSSNEVSYPDYCQFCAEEFNSSNCVLPHQLVLKLINTKDSISTSRKLFKIHESYGLEILRSSSIRIQEMISDIEETYGQHDTNYASVSQSAFHSHEGTNLRYVPGASLTPTYVNQQSLEMAKRDMTDKTDQGSNRKFDYQWADKSDTASIITEIILPPYSDPPVKADNETVIQPTFTEVTTRKD
jgi:hypothetical protein